MDGSGTAIENGVATIGKVGWLTELTSGLMMTVETGTMFETGAATCTDRGWGATTGKVGWHMELTGKITTLETCNI